MTDSQEKKAKDTRDSRTINIEIPAGILEAMYKMMNGRGRSETAASSCCEMPRDVCCPESEDAKEQDFTFVLKSKE